MHDCHELGCEVSWDGYAMRDGVLGGPAAGGPLAASEATPVAAGERVQGASDHDPTRFEQIDDHTVRRIAL